MPHRSLVVHAVAPLVALLALAACSDEGDGGGRDDGPSSEGRSDVYGERLDREGLAPCTTEPTATDGLTDPGQVLCFGTDAVVPVEHLTGSGTAAVTVTGLERADDVLLDDVVAEGRPDLTAEARDLWFVRVEGRLLGEDEPGAVDGAQPLDSGTTVSSTTGDSGESATLLRDLDDCDEQTFGDHGRRRFASCEWSALPTGSEAWSVRLSLAGDRGQQVVWAAE